MIQMEDYCVGCTPDLPCIGEACPYKYPIGVRYCDQCGEVADYIIEDEDYCEDCAKQYLNSQFNDLTVSEMAELLDIDCSSV